MGLIQTPKAFPDQPKVDQIQMLNKVPPWVMPMSFNAANGRDSETAVNGIGFTDPNGNILIYRLFTADDWLRFPDLVGVKEVWFEFFLSPTE